MNTGRGNQSPPHIRPRGRLMRSRAVMAPPLNRNARQTTRARETETWRCRRFNEQRSTGVSPRSARCESGRRSVTSCALASALWGTRSSCSKSDQVFSGLRSGTRWRWPSSGTLARSDCGDCTVNTVIRAGTRMRRFRPPETSNSFSMRSPLIQRESSGASMANGLSNRPFDRAGLTSQSQCNDASTGRSTPIRSLGDGERRS